VARFAKRHLVATAIAVTVLGGAVGVAIAQVGDGDSPESPESGVRGVGVPEGPFVDFCPTPAQTEEHLKLYGFDYKPTLACTREGEAPSPTAEQRADTANDPDEGVSDTEACKEGKDLLESAVPARDSDGDPGTVEGVLPDGTAVKVVPFGTPKLPPGWSIRDEARVYSC
jgi:hypothetical protein